MDTDATQEIYVNNTQLVDGFAEGNYVIFTLTSRKMYHFKGTIPEFKTVMGL